MTGGAGTPPDASTAGLARDARASGPGFTPGDVVAGRYRVVRFVAQGGMGEVYEAEDAELGMRVGLKTIRTDARDPSAPERFKREIQLARRVTHPNVCRIFDLGVHRAGAEAPEVLFLTMELLRGETLAARLAREGRIAPALALPLVEQMAGGLGAAHAAGIVHRDFKSANVMLETEADGTRAVVTDFGLAKGPAGGDVSLTATGVIPGTPDYLAPEQVEGGRQTPATDVYALGVVLYEMTTGQRPFKGDSALSIAVKRLREPPPPPRSLAPTMDARWEAVILRCLEREPTARFAHASEVVRALRGEVSVRPLSPRTGWLAAAALAGVAGLGWWLARGERPRPVVEPAAATTPGSPAPARAPRPAVAVLGFRNLGGASGAWLSTALTEMLSTELSAGETLRLVAGETVAHTRLDLSLDATESYSAQTLSRLRAALSTDYTLSGSYLALPAGGKIRLDIRVQDARAGETVTSLSESGSEAELFDLVARAGARVRDALGVGTAIATPHAVPVAWKPEAARFYAEGLARLRVFDALGARDRLVKAAGVDPANPVVASALAETWSRLGYSRRAADEARRAFQLSAPLSREDKLVVEARYRTAAHAWDRAIEIHRILWSFFPDNLDYGLRLAEVLTLAGRPLDAVGVIDELRRLPPPERDDPRIDVAEAATARALSDVKREAAAGARAAAKAEAQGARLVRAQGLLAQGWATGRLGDKRGAIQLLEDARALYAATGDRSGACLAIRYAAIQHSDLGDIAAARRMLEEILGLNRAIGNRHAEAATLVDIGDGLLERGELASALRVTRESVDIFREIDDRAGFVTSLSNLGLILAFEGKLAEAQAALDETLSVAGQIHHKSAEAVATYGLGWVGLARGDAAEARGRFEHALALTREMDQRFVAYALYALAQAQLAEGDLAAARKSAAESLAIRTRIGASVTLAESQVALAAIDLEQGHVQEAIPRLVQAADVFHAQDAPEKEALARCALARARLLGGQMREAQAEAAQAASLVARRQSRLVALAVALAGARVEAAAGHDAEARRRLAEVDAEASRAGYVEMDLEARLVRAEVDAASKPDCRKAFSDLAAQARARRLGRIGALAERSASRCGTSAPRLSPADAPVSATPGRPVKPEAISL